MGCLTCSKCCECCCKRSDRVPQSPARVILKVAICSTVMSILTVVSSGVYLAYIWQKKVHYNTHPNLAADLLAALVIFSVSVYQLVICSILLRKATSVTATAYNLYYVSLWYVSHLSLLTIYGGLIFMEIFLCALFKDYLRLTIIVAVATVYMGIFSTLVAVVIKQLPAAAQF